jgi:fatty acid desaturase
MSRWARILLTCLAALIGGWAGLIAIGGGAAGIAWIFLFGDDPWPKWSEIAIPLVALAGSLAAAWVLGFATWRSTGRSRS